MGDTPKKMREIEGGMSMGIPMFTILISIRKPTIISQEAYPKIKNNIELKFAPNAPKRLFGFSSPTLKGDGSNSS